MKDLSLHILDIAQNSVRAGADKIGIFIFEDDVHLELAIKDNGCGMTEAELSRVSDPSFTTKAGHSRGLGVPLLLEYAEKCGGYIRITSSTDASDHGTSVYANFPKSDEAPIVLGDIAETLAALVYTSPSVDFEFEHSYPGGKVRLSVPEMREILGDARLLCEPEMFAFVKEYVSDRYTK